MVNIDMSQEYIIKDVRSHLLHKSKMCFLNDEVVIYPSSKTAIAKCRIQENGVYLNQENLVEEYWLVEFMAQTVAVLYRSSRKKNEMGYLLSIDHLTYFSNPEIRAGNNITLQAKLTVDMFPFGVYEASTYFNDQHICHAKMKFVTDPKGEMLD